MLRGGDDGVAAIEFALIVPMLALILVGVLDYGLYTIEHMKVQSLSRQAAEYVVQGGQEADVETTVVDTRDFFTETAPNRTSVTFAGHTCCECADGIIAVTCSSSCPGNDYLRSYYAVTITAVYTPFLPYPGIADGVTLTGYSRLQYAR